MTIKEKISYLLMGIALFMSAMLSGGLKWQDCILAMLCLLALVVFSGKIKRIKYSVPLMLLMILSFVSVFITLGNPQTSIYEIYKFNCFIIAVLAGYLLRDSIKILKIIFITAFIVAVFGILACLGIINFDEFIFNDGGIVRLQSFIKYANTTACFLGVGYISFLKLFLEEKKNIYLYMGSIVLIALYFTFSKAMIPIFLVLSTFYIYRKKELSSIFLVQNIASMILLGLMLLLVPERMYLVLFIAVAVATIISGKAKENENSFKIWVLVLALIFAGAIALVILKPSLAGTFIKRLEYSKDAIGLIKENPLLGTGFGSWRVLQYKIQTTQYNVTYLHNGILEMIIENGILFTVIFLSTVIYGAVNAVKREEYHLVLITLMILIHSLVDCDLSFGVILILLGLVVGRMLPEKDSVRIPERIVNYILVVFLSVSAVYMLSEYALRYSFEKAYIAEDYDKASEKLNKLSKLSPLDAELKITEAAFMEMENDISGTREKIEKAIELSSNDPGIYETYITYNLKEENAENLLMNYIKIAPKQERTYNFIKEILKEAKKTNNITGDTYQEIYDKIENIRIKEEVIDRNELLSQIVKDGK